MSTGAECAFVEAGEGRWFYLLQTDQPQDDEEYHGDWRANAVVWGPFASDEEAQAHLHSNYANPGGRSVLTHEYFEPSDRWAAFEARAVDPGALRGRRW